jgi:hypothetical protein
MPYDGNSARTRVRQQIRRINLNTGVDHFERRSVLGSTSFHHVVSSGGRFVANLLG